MRISVGTSCKKLVDRRQKTEDSRSSARSRLAPAVYCLLSTAYCLLLFACGKIGDPLPPIPRAPLTVSELNVVQQGSRLNLSFPMNRPPRSERLQRIDIFRLIEPESAPLGLTQETFAERASVIATIPGEKVKAGSS